MGNFKQPGHFPTDDQRIRDDLMAHIPLTRERQAALSSLPALRLLFPSFAGGSDIKRLASLFIAGFSGKVDEV